MNDAHLFAAAREVAKTADYSGSSAVKIGCVVSYKKTILAKGANSNKTHPTQARFNRLRFAADTPHKCHAELTAIRKIRYLDIDMSKVTIYTYRELKDGSLALSRPCPACLAAIKAMGIEHIAYTTPDGYAKETLKKEI